MYDMVFNGAAPPAAGVLKTSPGRYVGQDNGWVFVYANQLVNHFNESLKEFPNIQTALATASLGSGSARVPRAEPDRGATRDRRDAEAEVKSRVRTSARPWRSRRPRPA